MTDADHLTPRTVMPVNADPLLARSFNRGQVTGLRHDVASCARASGLTGQRLDDFVLAVNELISNAIRHGGGKGQLLMWRADQAVSCEVSDGGLGIGAAQLANRDRPTLGTAGGWGLWLARRLSDEMVVRTGPDGTSIRITATIGRTDRADIDLDADRLTNPD